MVRIKINSKHSVNNDGSGTLDFTFAIEKPDAEELTFSVGGGCEFNKREWSITPYGRVDYTKVKIESFAESASDDSVRASIFRFNEQNIEYLTSYLGVKAS